ncbi:periplasmic binding protein-like II [Anaeromyces robustus]|uniref:Periplasmic binding protein-like II n=1 Tax=Anaeromyces robustus TaxID=1754192 RepID=A0A1Y1XEF6_9FUNG|nr:periplasmic binding protein-like II [Anaeromyces robustus]|eukprot:ORX84161.1 periplasmic binding protein-like II [Anaeromyces robustus]
MIYLNILLLIYFFSFLYEGIRATIIDALAFSYSPETHIYGYLINEFNKYSEENGLDVQVNLNLISKLNGTSLIDGYGSMLETLLIKKSTRYDLFFYDNCDTFILGSHYIDLYDWLSKDHIDMYDMNIIKQTCFYNDKLVGLPVSIDLNVLYYDTEIFEKYNNITIPKTWEELIDICKYIMEKEDDKEKYYCYNGLYSNEEVGTCSLYDFIYSYRKSKDSPFPELTSQEAIDSLKMIKTLKNEIASDEIFTGYSEIFINPLFKQRFLFLKFWYMDVMREAMYEPFTPPGNKIGISGSAIGGYNVGINKYSSDTKKKASIKVIEYITSKDIQKKIITEKKLISAMTSLYDEEDICNVVDCEFFKSLQPIGRPITKMLDYNSYSEKFRNYIYEYLYGDKTPEEVLKRIDDITKTYYISLKTNDSSVGLIFFIVACIISTIILLSLIFLFFESYSKYFEILRSDFWVISMIGLILIIFSGFTELEGVTSMKCHLKVILISFGFTLHYIPILYTLNIHFPDNDNILEWFKKHPYPFLFIFIILDILLNCLLFIKPYDIQRISDIQSQNYNIYYIQIRSYTFSFTLQELNHLTLATINCILLFGYRIVWGFLENKNKNLKMISKVNKKFIDNCESVSKSCSDSNIGQIIQQESVNSPVSNKAEIASVSGRISFMTKILSYHYQTSELGCLAENETSIYTTNEYSNITKYMLNVLKYKGTTLTINAIAFSYSSETHIYEPLINEFNKYSKENELDINVVLNLLTLYNTSLVENGYEATLETLLKKKNAKYDLFFYDNSDTYILGSYFVDLYEQLNKEHINMYNENILSQTSIYNDKLVGLPVSIDLTVFYYNENIFNNYEKEIPKTWEELLDTCKYILKKEKIKNENFLCFKLFMNKENESSSCLLYDFIYSYRKSKDSPFPEITSQEAIDSLKMMKTLKNEIGIGEINESLTEYFNNIIYTNNTLFTKYWYMDSLNSMNYKPFIPPGNKEGISGSTIGGYNIGINKYSSEANKKAALKVIEFITSKDIQKMIITERKLISAITDLYNATDVCEIVDCELFKNLQPIGRPISKTTDYYSYSEKFRNYIIEYLEKNKISEIEALTKIDDITKIFYISLKTNDSIVGLTFFIISSIVSMIILSSLIFLFFESYSKYFEFLRIDFWIISMVGLIFIIYSGFTELEGLTSFKCTLKIILLSYGTTFHLIPFLHALIVYFPDDYDFFDWIKKHPYLFLSIFILIDTILNCLMFIKPFYVRETSDIYSKKYLLCNINNGLLRLLITILIVFKFFIIVIILLLIFIEWNVKNIIYDTRMLNITMFINTLNSLLIIILSFIQIKYFTVNFILQEINYLFIGVSNYITLFGYKIILGLVKNKNLNIKMVANVNKNFINNTESETKSSASNIQTQLESQNPQINYENSSTEVSRRKLSIIKRVLTYHYQTYEYTSSNLCSNNSYSKSNIYSNN